MENLPSDLTSMADIQSLAQSGFDDWKRYGDVNVSKNGDLLLFNYSPLAQYAGRWNFFEGVSRGLIIHRMTGEIVARPFDKFHNWLEGGRRATGYIVSVTEKIDGSLGILWRATDGYRVATRGSFNGEQATWATAFLRQRYDLSTLPDAYTLLFEIVYPSNRIVVDYGERQDLVLLAVRNRHTGVHLPFFPDVYELAEQYGFSLPTVYQFNDIATIIEQTGVIDSHQEGWVVEFSDGSRYKFKGDRYRELHRMISGLSFKNTLLAMTNGKLDALRALVPDEFMTEVNAWVALIERVVADTQAHILSIFAQAPQDSRKAFAEWVTTYHTDLSAYLFAQLDNRPLEPLIYANTDWNRYSYQVDTASDADK